MKSNTSLLCEYLLKSINFKNIEIFKRLESSFPTTLKRDPELGKVT